MDYNQETSLIPLKPIIYGCLIMLFTIFILTVILAITVELGWMGTIQPFSNDLYIVLFYLAVVTGSIMAGLKSGSRGWLAGIGVGLCSSIILMILTVFLGLKVNVGIYLVKVLLSSFIGIFGGIIGVNIGGGRR